MPSLVIVFADSSRNLLHKQTSFCSTWHIRDDINIWARFWQINANLPRMVSCHPMLACKSCLRRKNTCIPGFSPAWLGFTNSTASDTAKHIRQLCTIREVYCSYLSYIIKKTSGKHKGRRNWRSKLRIIRYSTTSLKSIMLFKYPLAWKDSVYIMKYAHVVIDWIHRF